MFLKVITSSYLASEIFEKRSTLQTEVLTKKLKNEAESRSSPVPLKKQPPSAALNQIYVTDIGQTTMKKP